VVVLRAEMQVESPLFAAWAKRLGVIIIIFNKLRSLSGLMPSAV